MRFVEILRHDRLFQGKLDVNGPLPADFDAIFKQAAAKATKECKADEMKVVEKNAVASLLQTLPGSQVGLKLLGIFVGSS